MSANQWVIRALILGISSACSAPESSTPSPGIPSGGAPAGGSAGSNATGGLGEGGTSGASGGAAGGNGGAAGTSGATNGGGGQAGSTGGNAGAGGAGGGDIAPGAMKDGETQLSSQALAVVSFGGYLNGEAFQQDGIITHQGYQYTAFWNTARHVVLARRELPSGAWSSLEFTDYTNTESDAHNTISIGIAPDDGTLHLAFDHHITDLNYRRSVTGLVSSAGGAWQTSSFSATTDALVNGVPVQQLTYPRFITRPTGEKLLMSARIGTSGSGDEYLWEYDTESHAWASLGKYLDGVSGDVNAYLHGIAYTPGGTRLHAAWCWRETPDASTNHDLAYIYSDDHGRTWKNNAGVTIGTTGTTVIDQDSEGLHVFQIGQNRGLINQEHLTVDALGRVHVLLSHLPDDEPDESNFESARGKSEYFHYLRELDGTWKRTALGLPVVANLRGKLALSSSQNLYAILPDLRIAGAAKSEDYAEWTVFDDSDSGRFFSDPLIDSARLLLEDKLSVVYQEKASSDLFVLDYTLK